VQAPGPIQALILTPTRELAIQVQEQLHTWSKQVRSLAVYGGQPIPVQFKALRQGVQVVVATPGRLIDHMERGSIELSGLKYCVLDEADEMLDFGFEEELNTILEQVPSGCRMALFSATFPTKIKQLAGRHMADAQKIEIQATQRTVSAVEQYYCLVRPGKKARSLGRILDHQDPGPSLVFCRTRLETQQLTDELRRRGYAAECLHGEMDQSERERVMDRFKQNQCRILVATDIAARGLDVDGITHVFNYDIPWDVEHYIHRVGRTARAGRSGIAITVIEPSQQRHLQRIERESGAKFQAYAVPTMEQISTGRSKRFAERIRQQLEDPACQEQLPLVQNLAKQFDPMAVAAAALQALWHDSYSAMAEDADDDLSPATRSYVWMSISVGRRDGMNPAELLQTVHQETGFGKMELGKIHIEDNRTLVEIPADKADKMILDLRRARIKGKRVKVDLTAPPAGATLSRGGGRKPFAGKPSFDRGPAGSAPPADGPAPRQRPKRNYEPAGASAVERPAREKPFREPAAGGERPAREKPFREPAAGGERPAREKPFREPAAGGERPAREKTFRDKPVGAKSFGDKPFREKGPKVGGDKPFRDRGPKAVGDKPFREKPPKGFPKAGKPGKPSASDGRKPANKKGNTDKKTWVGGSAKPRKK
jgi:ATP-dependent RNA helicase DeaD